MKYEEFKDILNKKIFEESKADLIRKFAKYPERYVGLFRPTKPKGKILQNLTQSHEIKFGNAFETIVEKYFLEYGFNPLEKIFINEKKKKYDLDQLFEKEGDIIFIEQKVRDDHDSSKKSGQIDNFIRKIEILNEKYPENKIKAFFYFIDPSLKKNRKYYAEQMSTIKKDYGLNECLLVYGDELFTYFGMNNVWGEVLDYLKRWRDEIPDMPEINFDKDVDSSFEKIKNIEPNLFLKILRNDEIFKNMILTVSPEKKLIRKLVDYFKERSGEKTIYKTLYNLGSKRLNE